MRTAAFLLACLFPSFAAVAAPGTVEVRRGRIEAVVVARGELRARVAAEVRLDLRAGVANPVLRRLAPAGTVVQEGEPVLGFDPRPWMRASDEAREALESAEFARRILRRRQALERASAERGLLLRGEALERARDDLRAWVEHERPRAEDRDRLEAESDAQALANERAELEQLELMYEEDELVDETEEIVLERARYSLRRRIAINELNARQRAWRAEWEWPRRRESLERSVRDREVELESTREDNRIADAAREKAFADSERSVRDRRRKLEEIEADLRSLDVRAPAGGMVLHGWIEGGFGRRHRVGGNLDLSQPVVTIVDPADLRALVRVPAREIPRIRTGQRAKVRVEAAGAEPREARILSVAALAEGGHVEVRLAIEEDLPPTLLGLPLDARIITSEKEDALLLPLDAIRRDAGRAFCLVAREVGEPREVDVVTGEDDGKDVEVLSGLSEGDVVILPGGGK